ncbi:MAG: hypothetical protein E7231_06245 [Cellulosilyticum sp.]|nr:hypothetical protein [Cellulosilyticum sp.]
MKKIKIRYFLMCVLLIIGCVGCKQDTVTYSNEMQIYFFDSTKNELVGEPLSDDFFRIASEQEKVEYIISRLKENKSTLLTSLQMGPTMPIESNTTSINTKDRVVKVDFTNEYDALTPQQKIGMRAAIVYSLTELEFIDGVDFYVEQTPLSTAIGKLVGIVYRSDINKDALAPNPATKSYVLNVYFADQEGKLVKEVHRIIGSDSTKEEKFVVEELIQGPKTDELLATVPSDMKVNTIDTLNGVCQVDLSFDPKSKFFKDDEAKTLMIYSIVNSLTELPQVKKVIISIDGQEEVALTPEIDLPNTFERSEAYINQKESTS